MENSKIAYLSTTLVDTYGYDDSLTGYEPVFASREASESYDNEYKLGKRRGNWAGGVFSRKRQRIAPKAT